MLKTPKETIFQASFPLNKPNKTPLYNVKQQLQSKKQFQQEFQGCAKDVELLATVIEMEESQIEELEVEAKRELNRIQTQLNQKQQLLQMVQTHIHLPQVMDLQCEIQQLQLEQREWESSLA